MYDTIQKDKKISWHTSWFLRSQRYIYKGFIVDIKREESYKVKEAEPLIGDRKIPYAASVACASMTTWIKKAILASIQTNCAELILWYICYFPLKTVHCSWNRWSRWCCVCAKPFCWGLRWNVDLILSMNQRWLILIQILWRSMSYLPTFRK